LADLVAARISRGAVGCCGEPIVSQEGTTVFKPQTQAIRERCVLSPVQDILHFTLLSGLTRGRG
jgi:hypothetical protein